MSKLKNARGFLYGLALAIAVSAGAATVYNYFPPPGMTYAPTTGFVVGSATGGAQGAGTVNAQGVFVNGAAVVTGAGLPVGANPTGTVGLTAVNGSATTFLRSDGAPPLSQAISPTWTGTHIFNGAASSSVATSGWTIGQASNRPNLIAIDTNGAADNKVWQWITSGGTDMIFRVQNDASSVQANILDVTRSGATITGVAFGNATNNPTYSFLGTGTFNVAGGVTIGSPTGGSQGAGTINMQGCFVNGVACSTGGAAGGNPTASVGLTAVNGSAGTFLRSDGAPALSQAIVPTWTGLHTFGATRGFQVTRAGNTSALFWNSLSAADQGKYLIATGTTGLVWQTENDAETTQKTFFEADRTGNVVTAVSFGNATDNPTYSFLGTGGVQMAYLGVGIAPSSGVTRIRADNGGSGDTEILSETTTAGNAQFRATNLGGGNWSFGNLRSNGNFVVCQNSVLTTGCPLTINTASQVIINGASGQYAEDVLGNSTASNSFGLFVGSGTNSSDVAMLVQNQAQSTNYFKIDGAGSITTGTNTGQGANTINANALYESGNFVYREIGWAGTCTSGGCTTGIAKGVGTAVTRNSAGNYTVTFSAAMGTGNASCTANPWSTLNNGAISATVSTANTTTVNVVVINSSGTAVDSGFSVVCIG